MDSDQSLDRSRIPFPREGDSFSDAGKHQRAASARLTKLTNFVSETQRLIGQIPRTTNATSGLHPFKIYNLPWRLRPAGTTTPGDWLKFRVRQGKVIQYATGPEFNSAQTIIDASGTDGCDNPDIETYLDDPAAADTVLVPDVAQYWFWLDLTTIAGKPAALLHSGGYDSKNVLHGEDPAPIANPGADPLIPLGYVDTATLQATKQAIVRQIIRYDIILGLGGGGGGIVKGPLVAVFGDYLVIKLPGNTLVPVAKPQRLRNSVFQETIFGTLFTFFYPHNPGAGLPPTDPMAYVRRTCNSSLGAQFHDIIKPWILGEEIVAFTTQATGIVTDPVDPNFAPRTAITYLDANNGSHDWMMSPNQSAP